MDRSTPAISQGSADQQALITASKLGLKSLQFNYRAKNVEIYGGDKAYYDGIDFLNCDIDFRERKEDTNAFQNQT